MKDIVSVVYFNNESYLHNLYVGYGISSIKTLPCTVQTHFVSQDNLKKVCDTIVADCIIAFLSMDHYALFRNFCITIGKKATIIVCHYTPTFMGKELMLDLPDVDYVVEGEPEQTLRELLYCIENGGDFLKCRGILFRNGEKIVRTDKRLHIKNLDSLPFADRDAIPNTSNVFHIFASRGCERNCSFCDRNALYVSQKPPQRFRSISNVISEIDHLVSAYQCRFVTFSDSTFCSNNDAKERLNSLYQQLVVKNYWVQFFMNLRAEQIDKETFQCLQNLKCVGLGKVFVGIESFNPGDLRLYNKLSNYQANHDALEIINSYEQSGNDYRVEFEYGFILFNPYTSINDLIGNLNQLQINKIPFTPNIISSRLVCNYYQPVITKIDSDGLLVTPLSEMTLEQKNSSDLKYRFVDKTVEKIYETIVSCYHAINIKLPSNVCFVRNRYYRFIGADNVLHNLDLAYATWQNEMSAFCQQLLSTVIELESHHIPSAKWATEFCIQFKKSFQITDKHLKTCLMRALIQLHKIGEEIYEGE